MPDKFLFTLHDIDVHDRLSCWHNVGDTTMATAIINDLKCERMEVEIWRKNL